MVAICRSIDITQRFCSVGCLLSTYLKVSNALRLRVPIYAEYRESETTSTRKTPVLLSPRRKITDIRIVYRDKYIITYSVIHVTFKDGVGKHYE